MDEEETISADWNDNKGMVTEKEAYNNGFEYKGIQDIQKKNLR